MNTRALTPTASPAHDRPQIIDGRRETWTSSEEVTLVFVLRQRLCGQYVYGTLIPNAPPPLPSAGAAAGAPGQLQQLPPGHMPLQMPPPPMWPPQMAATPYGYQAAAAGMGMGMGYGMAPGFAYGQQAYGRAPMYPLGPAPAYGPGAPFDYAAAGRASAAQAPVPPSYAAAPASAPAPAANVVIAPAPPAQPAREQVSRPTSSFGPLRTMVCVRDMSPTTRFCDTVVELVELRTDGKFTTGIVTDYTHRPEVHPSQGFKITFWDQHGEKLRGVERGTFLLITNLKIKRNRFEEIEGKARPCRCARRCSALIGRGRRPWALNTRRIPARGRLLQAGNHQQGPPAGAPAASVGDPLVGRAGQPGPAHTGRSYWAHAFFCRCFGGARRRAGEDDTDGQPSSSPNENAPPGPPPEHDDGRFDKATGPSAKRARTPEQQAPAPVQALPLYPLAEAPPPPLDPAPNVPGREERDTHLGTLIGIPDSRWTHSVALRSPACGRAAVGGQVLAR